METNHSLDFMSFRKNAGYGAFLKILEAPPKRKKSEAKAPPFFCPRKKPCHFLCVSNARSIRRSGTSHISATST